MNSSQKSISPEEAFLWEIKQSVNRVSKKFSKICDYLASKGIHIVNASYGISYKSIMIRFAERYKELTTKEIEQTKLKLVVDDYFRELLTRGEKTIRKYPQLLFIFSAGNSGFNNDEYPHYPSNIKTPNALTIAAMNGEHLATFSNYGQKMVEIGAPGVAVLSLLPKVYQAGAELYSLSSGTSMAAPYVSNIAAQITNINPQLSASQIKIIITQSGEILEHLKDNLSSSSLINNQRAIKVALLSRDMPLEQAIMLGRSNIVPVEDKINFSLAPAKAAEDMKKNILESIPSPLTPEEVSDEPVLNSGFLTKEESSSPLDQEKEQPGMQDQLPSTTPNDPLKSSDQGHSSQILKQSQPPSLEKVTSSSEAQLKPLETQSQDSGPSSP
jgi:Subtilase family